MTPSLALAARINRNAANSLTKTPKVSLIERGAARIRMAMGKKQNRPRPCRRGRLEKWLPRIV